ncbi:MAG TPA: peptidylprolyl isomerase [Candidatus Acidoferrum sp.]|nr:peptidylprolyl isomerase [Candidatus Acidoferrum sp.]
MNSRDKAGKIAVSLKASAIVAALAIAIAPFAQTSAAQKTAAAGPGAAKKRAATTARAYDRALLRPALLKDKAPAEYKVKFVTTRGEFTLAVTRAWAPLGADRFYNLVKHHFYDNASIFRVVPNFVAQFGISAYPAVTTAWKSTDIKDDPVTQSNKKGYITFATSGPNTRTTQVFINLTDNARLDKMGFAPFGVVEGDGMKVVNMFYDQYGDTSGPEQDKIESQGKPYVDKGWPKLDTIKSATLLTSVPATASKPAPAVKKPQ